jgi:hypothetical protein
MKGQSVDIWSGTLREGTTPNFVIYIMPFLVNGMSVLHKLAEEDDGCFELALSSYDICHI